MDPRVTRSELVLLTALLTFAGTLIAAAIGFAFGAS